MKTKTVFICQSCGYQTPKWSGRCPDCSQWNTIREDFIPAQTDTGAGVASVRGSVENLGEIEIDDSIRIKTRISEFDRVLGGGLVPGSVVLIGGDPGIGKSTLVLQACSKLSSGDEKVLYITGEESSRQTKLRANRLGVDSKNLYVLNETNADAISSHIESLKPKVAVIDSIQVVYSDEFSSSPGSVSQVRACAQKLSALCKAKDVCLLVIGHVTKEGLLAGPRVLEHLVDTVLYFEGERFASFRILRAVKNRFGSTNEMGVFEMTAAGLDEVANPSSVFLSERAQKSSGSVIVPTIEGMRALLVEIQALVSPAAFNVPARRSTGIDYNKLNLLIAVLEKRVGLKLSSLDCFLNVVGGVKILEPAVDLGAALAIASSVKDVSIDQDTVVLGEVGLAGEVRAVSRADARLKEAEKLGFRAAILPKRNIDGIKTATSIKLQGGGTLKDAINIML